MRKTLLAMLRCLALDAAAQAAPIAACPGGKTYADYIALAACLLGDKALSYLPSASARTPARPPRPGPTRSPLRRSTLPSTWASAPTRRRWPSSQCSTRG